MLRSYVIDFNVSLDYHLLLIEFSYNNSYHSSISMEPFEALYGRRCSSLVGWFEVGNSSLIRLDIIYKVIEKDWVIKYRLKTTYSWQKSYADNIRRDLDFEIGDHVYLKISPMKVVMRFGKRGKLSPQYIGPYEVLQQVGKVAYEMKLPNELALVHPVFHVSMLLCSRNVLASRCLF